MSKYGKRLINFLKQSGSQQTDNMFIGVVRGFVDKDSNLLQSYSNSDLYKDYIDNRNVIYVTPTDQDTNSIEPAVFLNSHEMDVPLLGEAVLCVSTELGNVVIDRLSSNQFALNYDSYAFLLDNVLGGEEFEIQLPEGYENEFNKESFRNVAPFFPKVGSKNWLGRNNQYIIFDHGSRRNAGVNEETTTEDGSFVKIGIRREGEQTDTREDRSVILLARDASLNNLMTEHYRSEDKLHDDAEPQNGMGFQSEQMILYGDRFTVIYSRRDVLIEARERAIIRSKKLFIDNDETILDSDKIKLGSDGANQSYVKGQELVSMLREIISLIENGSYLVTGTSAVPDPTYMSRLKAFKARKLNKNTRILSKKIKGE